MKTLATRYCRDPVSLLIVLKVTINISCGNRLNFNFLQQHLKRFNFSAHLLYDKHQAKKAHSNMNKIRIFISCCAHAQNIIHSYICSIKLFCWWTVRALSRLRGCEGLSGLWLSAYALKTRFRMRKRVFKAYADNVSSRHMRTARATHLLYDTPTHYAILF